MTKTILAIDDSPSVRMMVQMTLTSAGYSVVLAGDGEEGLQKALAHKPDAVLTDQNMPRLDGIGFIRKFRQSQQSAGVPVVFISTESSPATMQQARDAGATGWIVKPFNGPAVIGGIKKLIGA